MYDTLKNVLLACSCISCTTVVSAASYLNLRVMTVVSTHTVCCHSTNGMSKRWTFMVYSWLDFSKFACALLRKCVSVSFT